MWFTSIVLTVALLIRVPPLGRFALLLLGLAFLAKLVRKMMTEPADSKDNFDTIGTSGATKGPKEVLRLLAEPADEETEDGERELVVQAPEHAFKFTTGLRNEVPVITVEVLIGEPTEMVFAIRRKRSSLALTPLVDNTPIQSASIEYRLRRIPLGRDVASYFDAATNRPRLFRELLSVGFEDALITFVDHPQYRVEDMVYNGKGLTFLIQPALEPTSGQYVDDCVRLVEPLLVKLTSFLETAIIPSAQEE
jgi:hypothetical protein